MSLADATVNIQSPVLPVSAHLSESYRLIEQVGADRAAVVFRGERLRDQLPVEVRIPKSAGWQTAVKKALLVKNPTARPILEISHDTADGYVVLPWFDGVPLIEWRRANKEAPLTQRAAMLQRLLALMVECHQLGLATGTFAPHLIRMTSAGEPEVELVSMGLGNCLTSDQRTGHDHDFDQEAGEDIRAAAELVGWLLLDARDAPGSAIAQALRGVFEPGATGQTRMSLALHRVAELCDAARSGDEERRPTARALANACETAFRLRGDQEDLDQTAFRSAGVDGPARLEWEQTRSFGRFEVLGELGRGGMGVVYKARDAADGSLVALKVINPNLVRVPEAMARFRKEARILSRLRSPRIAQLIEINDDEGHPYLVVELIEGTNLSDLLKQRGALPEDEALRLFAPIAQALGDTHELGVVHRDVKPSNIMVTNQAPDQVAVKLLDFGVARQTVQSHSMAVTQTGAFLGTPTYMAPEQCMGMGEIGPATDVYALGIILFEMLTGEAPFQAPDPMKLASMHCYDKIPSLAARNPSIRDGVAQVINRCLAKKPTGRYENARELHRDIERLTRGEPTLVADHPTLPPHDPQQLLIADWSWELTSSPEQLWPYVSNTQRINRAAAIPAVDYETIVDSQTRPRLFGQFKMAGMRIRWEEHPFEWVEGRRMAILREFTQGPFRWFLSVVELTPRPQGGSTLRHLVKILPKNWFGRLVATLEVSSKGRRNVDALYRFIDQKVSTGAVNDPSQDAFEPPTSLTADQRRTLRAHLERLRQAGVSPSVLAVLGEFLEHGSAAELARIRPLEFAQRFRLDQEDALHAFLRAAFYGLLELRWDILCPKCRVASDMRSTLRDVLDHSHCDVCAEDFAVDFANSLEMVFRIQPSIRASDARTYCVGGPDHQPHVAAQIRLQAKERVLIDLALGASDYSIRGNQLPSAIALKVEVGRGVQRLEIDLPSRNGWSAPSLRAGEQGLTLVNTTDREMVVKIERVAKRQDAVTAAKAASLALFRELFPEEVLSEGRLVTVATTTFLAAEFVGVSRLFSELGDARAFQVMATRSAEVGKLVQQSGGAVVRREREGFFASFAEPIAALDAAVQLARQQDQSVPRWSLRAAIHRGPALVMNEQDHIDYFGGSVQRTIDLMREAKPGEVIVSEALAPDPAVASHLQERGWNARVMDRDVPSSVGAVPIRISSADLHDG